MAFTVTVKKFSASIDSLASLKLLADECFCCSSILSAYCSHNNFSFSMTSASASLPPQCDIPAVFLPKANRVNLFYFLCQGRAGILLPAFRSPAFVPALFFRHMLRKCGNCFCRRHFPVHKVLLQAFLFSLQWRVALQQAGFIVLPIGDRTINPLFLQRFLRPWKVL